jgi:hypothetical protein
MARWRQCKESGTLIPVDRAARAMEHSAAIQGDIESFVSPIDGTVITDRKQYREHMEKHNVVPASEFSPEFFERKAAERAKLYNGEHTPAEKFARKQEIYNHMQRAIDNG